MSLGLIGVLAVVFAAASRLTGLGNETNDLLGVLGPGSTPVAWCSPA